MRREEIERTDFPVGRRGYERAAVDGHLRRVADEFERREQDSKTSSLAATAGEKVSGIIAAAEEQAAEIEAEARNRAEGIVAEAEQTARSTVAEAERAVSGLVGQADELRRKVGELGQGLAGPSPAAETQPGPVIVPEPETPQPEVDPSPVIVPEPGPTPAPEPSPDTVPEPEPDPVPEPTPLPQPSEPDITPAAGTNGNDAGARLVAMKMALDGSSREDVEKRLAEEFGIGDPAPLLDDVFARAGR
jgi:DivIVA domain-containing protein